MSADQNLAKHSTVQWLLYPPYCILFMLSRDSKNCVFFILLYLSIKTQHREWCHLWSELPKAQLLLPTWPFFSTRADLLAAEKELRSLLTIAIFFITCVTVHGLEFLNFVPNTHIWMCGSTVIHNGPKNHKKSKSLTSYSWICSLSLEIIWLLWPKVKTF